MRKRKTEKKKVKKKKSNQKTIITVLFVVVFILGVLAGMLIPKDVSEQITEIDIPFEPSHEGFVQVEPNIIENILSFSTDCWVLSFGITQDQAYSIRRGIQNIIDVRPLTHDSLKDILETFDIEVLEAKIDEYTDAIFYAKLLVKKDDKILDLDVRPSDATAIAVRYNITIYVKEDILKTNGINICEI